MRPGTCSTVDEDFVFHWTDCGRKKSHQPYFELHVQDGNAEKSDINNSTVIRLDLIKKGSGIASYPPPSLCVSQEMIKI